LQASSAELNYCPYACWHLATKSDPLALKVWGLHTGLTTQSYKEFLLQKQQQRKLLLLGVTDLQKILVLGRYLYECQWWEPKGKPLTG